MQILRFPLGQLQANCYFLIQDKKCLIIDPADEASFILEELQRRNLQLIGMFATHGHFDHIMAVGEIQKSFDVPFYIVKEDMFLVKRLNKTAEYFLGHNPYSLQPTHIQFLREGELKIKNLSFKIISTPGHTPGSCCLYVKKENILFTGDTIFKEGIGRYDHTYSSKKDLMLSIKKILALPKKTKIYPGHGEETSVEFLQKNSLFIF